MTAKNNEASLRVRPMQSDDLGSISAIEIAAHKAPWSFNILRDCLLVGYDFRVLELKHRGDINIVGYIISRYHENTGHVLNFCVAPEQQRKGFGLFLMQQYITSLLNPPIDRLLLEVRPSNEPALRLYKRLGFKQVGIKSDYYNDQYGVEDAVVLQKNIEVSKKA